MAKQNLIRFDWALKRLLRNKANYKVLEGFLSELLREDVTIRSISESEGNQDSPNDKFNRVDILVEDRKKELIIIELQYSSEADYFSRMLYGVSRVITNYMSLGDEYSKVRKVYSVNIVYFEIGQGKDYIYHGRNEFRGIHEDDLLELSVYFKMDNVSRIFPEYYIIKVNDFDDVAKDTLDEWIYYLKNDMILDEFKAKGLAEAREILRVDNLPENEKQAYYHHVETIIFEESVISSAVRRGQIEGREEGRAEGKAEGKVEGRNEAYTEMVLAGYQNGLSVDMLQTLTGLDRHQIEHILKDKGLY